METDLKGLIDKIKQDGISKAQEEASGINREALAKAEDIVKKAQAQAKDIISKAQKEAETFRKSSESALKQAARDALLSLRARVTEFFGRVVKDNVSASLNPEVLKDIILKAVESSIQQGVMDLEIILSVKDRQNLEKALFTALRKEAKERVSLQGKHDIHGGFRIGKKDSGSYLDFTDQAIADGFKRYLSPKLADALDIDLGLKQDQADGQ